MGSCSWNCRQFSHLLDSLSLLPLIIIVVVVIVMIVVVMIMIITIIKVAVFGFEQHLEAAFDICGAACSCDLLGNLVRPVSSERTGC